MILRLAVALQVSLILSCAQRLPESKTSSPEELGYSSVRLENIKFLAKKYHSPAGMVLVGEEVLYQWGDVKEKFWTRSCRKSFLNALIGIAVTRRQIDLSQTLGDLKIDDIPPRLTESEKRASLRDLLMARSGIYHAAADETPEMQSLRPRRGRFPAGAHWYYNNWDFNVLGKVYEIKTGTSIFTAFNEQIAKPIGMEDFLVSDGSYHYESNKSQFPSFLFKMSTRDMARFGRLYLQGGVWQGQQILPKEWVEVSTTTHSETNRGDGSGYGYLWWTQGANGNLLRNVELGRNAFAAKGWGGHYILILPKYNMVVVARADDTWFLQDPQNRAIGPIKMGELVRQVLVSRLDASP